MLGNHPDDRVVAPAVNTRRVAASVVLIAWVSVLCARLISAAWLDDMPHVMDEVAYDLQAQTLALGRLTAPEARPRALFHQWFVEDRGRRFGIFPPGWPALLAIGHGLGLERWVDPVLHGLTVLMVGFIGYCFGGAVLARLAALLYGLCPQALILAGSIMSQTLTAWLASVALGLMLMRFATPPSAAWRHDGVGAAAVGSALGLLVATRPLCAVAIGASCAVVLLAYLRRGMLRPAHAWALPALLVPIVLLLLYNRALTGDAFQFPQTAYFDTHAAPSDEPMFRYAAGCNALGFGPSHGCELTGGTSGHTVRKAALHTLHNLRSLLLLAAGGGCLAMAVLVPLARHATRRLTLLLLTPLALVVAAYAAYWGAGTCYGARFYHAALPFGVLAAAFGLRELHARSRTAARIAWCLGLGAALVNIAVAVRVRAEISSRYWGTDERFIELRDHYRGPAALVLIAFGDYQSTSVPNKLTGTGVWHWPNGIRILSAQAANTPLLDGRLVFGRYHPALVAEAQREFPGRKVFVYLMSEEPRDDSLIPLERFQLSLHSDAPAPPENFSGVVLRTTR
jgi:hypothetical protein